MKPRILATVSLCLFFAIGTAANAAEFVMKYGHVGPTNDDSDDHAAGLFLKDYIETRSNGRIEVQIFPASQMGDFRESIEAVQLGTLELAHTTTGGITQFFPELQVTAIPYLVPNDTVAEELVDSQFFKDVRAEVLERTGNVLLAGISNTGRFRNFYTSEKQIKSAADLAGVKMRTIDSPLDIQFVQSLGANATPVAWGELYTALSTGVVEGTKNGAPDVVSNNLNEVLKYAVLDEHEYLYGYFWMSYSWLKGLPEDLQPLVLDGVREMAKLQTQFNKQVDRRNSEAFVANGGTYYTPTAEEKATFSAASEPMAEWFKNEYGAEWYDKFVASIEDAKAKIAADDDNVLSLQ